MLYALLATATTAGVAAYILGLAHHDRLGVYDKSAPEAKDLTPERLKTYMLEHAQKRFVGEHKIVWNLVTSAFVQKGTTQYEPGSKLAKRSEILW